MEQPLQNPIEDQRKAALEHYQEASRAIHHWSSFVESAIKAYNPEAVVTFSEPKEAEKEEKPDLIIDKAKYFHPEAGVVLAKTAINLIEEITTLRARIAKLEKKQ